MQDRSQCAANADQRDPSGRRDGALFRQKSLCKMGQQGKTCNNGNADENERIATAVVGLVKRIDTEV